MLLLHTLMKNIIDEIQSLFILQEQFDVTVFEDSFVTKTFILRMRENDCKNEDVYFHLLKEEKEERTIFIQSLFVCHSEFLRNALTFSVLEYVILPELLMKMRLKNKHELRIWSSACAHGQEAYSLAILLSELAEADSIKIQIFATDYSDENLTEAKEGVYSYNDISRISLNRLEKWFTKEGECYKIKNEIKSRVEFSNFNLLDNRCLCPPVCVFCDFDLIICSNILFYYKPEIRTQIINKISKSLSSIGYLVTSETERDVFTHNDFQEVYYKSAIYKKTT